MNYAWEDKSDYSRTADSEGCDIAIINPLAVGGFMWRTFVPKVNGCHSAGTTPTLDEAKAAAVAALPKPKGLRWEAGKGSYMDLFDGKVCYAFITTLMDIRFTGEAIDGVDEATLKRAAEAAVAVLRGEAAPAAKDQADHALTYAKQVESALATHGSVHLNWLIERFALCASSAVSIDRQKRDSKLFEEIARYLTPDRTRQIFKNIDAETSQR